MKMKNINSILIILLVANAFIACENESMNIEEETEFIVVAGFTYGKYNGVWYHVFDGEKGDQVGFDRLVVKPKTGIDMYIYDFQVAGVPILSVVSKLLS